MGDAWGDRRGWHGGADDRTLLPECIRANGQILLDTVRGAHHPNDRSDLLAALQRASGGR